MGDINSGLCKDCATPFTPECVKVRRYTVGYDNGRTPGSSTNDCGDPVNLVRFNHTFTVDSWSVNGTPVGVGEPLGPFASWGPQLQGWADFFTNNDPNQNAEGASGVDPAPTWRFAEISGCDPLATYGKLELTRDDGCKFTVFPVLETETIEMGFRFAEHDCDGNVVIKWLDADGEPMETPEDADCWVPCSFVFSTLIEADAVSPCATREPLDVCFIDGDGTQTNVTVIITDCPDIGRTVEAYTTESYLTAESPDDLVEFDLSQEGKLVNCDTGEEVVFPPVECDEPSIEVCEDPCVNGSTYIFGRPPAGEPWSWGPYSGENLVEFEAELTAAGYNVTQIGEKHQICPPFGYFGEDPDALVINAVGESEATVEPNIDPKFVPDNKCALVTTGKNDDRRDSLLGQLAEVVSDCECASGSASGEVAYQIADDAATEQSYGIGDVDASNDGDGIKFDTANDLSAELTAVHEAIRSCIAGGGIAATTITDQDGNTVEMDLDYDASILDGDGNVTQYAYEGVVLDGDPAGGKIRAMTTVCSTSSNGRKCLNVHDACTAGILSDLLAEQQQTNVLLQQLVDAMTKPCPTIATELEEPA